MNVIFDKSFSKSIDKLKNQQIKDRIFKLIEKCENVQTISELPNLKKLSSFTTFYRFKIGDYRIGLEIENDTIYFILVAHRKDIYKIFP